MACKLTIWTDFEVEHQQHQFTCDAIAKGDNALLNSGATLRLEMSDGWAIVRRRKWMAALLKTGNRIHRHTLETPTREHDEMTILKGDIIKILRSGRTRVTTSTPGSCNDEEKGRVDISLWSFARASGDADGHSGYGRNSERRDEMTKTQHKKA